MPHSLKTILVPVDNSKNSAEAFQYAVEMSEKYQSTMHVLHVVDFNFVDEAHYVQMGSHAHLLDAKERAVEQGMKETEDFVEKHLDNKQIKIEKIVRVGEPILEILIAAEELSADLIIMGTHGRTGLSHVFMGSVAEKVVRKAPCPVLTIKSQGLKPKAA